MNKSIIISENIVAIKQRHPHLEIYGFRNEADFYLASVEDQNFLKELSEADSFLLDIEEGEDSWIIKLVKNHRKLGARVTILGKNSLKNKQMDQNRSNLPVF